MSKKKNKKKLKKTVILRDDDLLRPSSDSSDNPRQYKFWSNWKALVSIFAVLVFGFICFSNSLDNEFVNWDDDKNFYENPHITSLAEGNFWTNTKEIFQNHVIGNYNPLSTWSFLLNNYFGSLDDPMPWHLTNLLLHLLCVFLVFRICLLLKLNWQGSAIVALLFAIHPMRVESVAWVTERKDVLFGFFYLAALFYFIKSKTKSKKYIIPVIFFFVLSLFSKIQAVALPLSMICVDYYLDERFSIRSILNKWFYFALSLATGLIGIYFLQDQGSLGTDINYSFFQRIFIGSYSYLVYVIKSIVPYQLSPLYPYPNEFPLWFYPSILSFISAFGLLLLGFKKKWKVLVFGIAFFSVNIIFVLQILGAGQGFLADRFTYIAYFGIFFVIGYYFQLLLANRKYEMPALVTASLFIGAMSWMTYDQNKIWKNSGTLWTHVLTYYDQTTLPFGNRANYYREKGETQKALADYSSSIALKNTNAPIYNSRAKLYFNSTNPDDWAKALIDYNNAIRIDPNNGEYYVNRGAIQAKMGHLNEAIQDFNKGLEIKPNHDVGYANRSVLFNLTGDIPNALKDIQSYLNLHPYSADFWFESALCKRRLQYQPEDVLGDLNKAIKYNNSKHLFYLEKSRVLYQLGRKAESQKNYQMARQLGSDPNPQLEELLK